MKILFEYLKPYKWLVVLTLFLAAINTGFSLIDPIIFGKLVKLAYDHQKTPGGFYNWDNFLSLLLMLLLASIGTVLSSSP